MPIDVPPPPPPAAYAYVVDVRPFDSGCVVPQCSIAGRDVSGYTHAVELDGNLGAYVQHGKAENEMFFRRAKVLRKGELYAFDIPESSAPSELDFSLSAEGAGAWSARLRITARRKAGPSEVVLEQAYRGETAAFKKRTTDAELGKIEQLERHLRLPLPSRNERMLHVTIENTGDGALALESPLVMRRVEGRGPRQSFVVVYDAVPFYLLDRVFTGTGDAPTDFVHKLTAERGVYFPRGYSPALCTQFFVRRFFRGGFFENDGEPILRGFDLDEDPPARSPTTIARVAERGFLTEAFVANFMLNPHASSTALDGGYQNEMIDTPWPKLYHPRAIAARFEAWLAEHSRDDTWAVIWMSTTHDALPVNLWSTARPKVPAPVPPEVTKAADYRASEVTARWENLLDSLDSTRAIFESAARHSPDASRLWFLGTDHGLIENLLNGTGGRAARYKGAIVGPGPIHRFFGATEEAWTPFGVIYDGVARPPGGPRVVSAPTMSAASWRAFERLFDVPLGLPETSSWDTAAFSPETYGSRWLDDGEYSLGHAGALRVGHGKWGYRGHDPSLALAPIWEQGTNMQLVLGGTDRRSGPFTSEELYDDEQDPLEATNVAGSHVDVVLAMRRRAQDFTSTYYDPPTHPRHRTALVFDRPYDLVIEGPRPFRLKADDADVTMASPRRATVHAKRVEILEDKDAVGLFSIRSAALPSPLLLRCAASGQPLDELGPERDRFDLALARNNCVSTAAGAAPRDATPPAGEVWLSWELVRSKNGGAASEGGMSGDTLEGLRRWGYVRDLDTKADKADKADKR